MTRPLRLLLIEDNADDALLVVRDLRRGGFDVSHTRVETAAAMEAALQEGGWQAIISDFSMPSFNASAALDVLKASGVDIPFIIVSGTVGEETAVASLKAGAHDFLSKQNLNRLVPALERELREAATRREHRALEQQLRQTQKMDAIGRLAGGIAHDFNNILTAIQGYATLLMRELPQDTQHHRDVGEILGAATRASSFTRQLLAFSRSQVTQPDHIDINDLVAGMHNLLDRLIGPAHTLDLELAPDGPLPVFVDRGQLSQVVMNLVVNARDATPDGGHIRIRTESHASDMQPHGHNARTAGRYAVVHVIDEGHGMSAEVADQIFEPFFTTKDAGKGTGLGLSTVYGIVKQHGGIVDLETAPGRGSRFTVYLPLSDAPPTAVAPVIEHEPARRAAESIVLVVEDSPQILDLVRRTLKRAGFIVITAADGREAMLAIQGDQHIDLMLTDLMLPDTNGIELVGAMRRLRPDASIVVMSGYTASEVALPPGVALVEKPFTPDALTACLIDTVTRSASGVPRSSSA